MEFFRRITEQFRQFFMGLSGGKKTALVMTAFAVVTSVSALLFWAGSSDYTVLATNLATDDATSIMRLLREKRIPFKVDDGGKTIKIPPDTVYDLRLEIATMGMPQSGVVGYEVFDKQSFGTTSFVQKINQKRALEGELMRTINNLKGVKRSRVHLALPSHSTFAEDQKKPTASVVLELEPGQQVADKQLIGVSRLVSAAVEGMEISDVTIVDANGKLLSKNNVDALAQQAATMLEFQQKQEAETEKKISEILTRVVGEGKVIAKVSMEFDFTQQSETQTQYDQEGSAVKSQQKENALADGARPVPMGQPGAASNSPGPAPASTNPEVRTNTQKQYEITNYAVPEKVIRSAKTTPGLKRLSVAVLVDGLYTKDATKGEDAAPVFQKWSDEKLGEFKAIVSNAIGVDPKRGDTIEVKNMEFRREDIQDAETQLAAYEKKKLIQNLVQYSLIGVIIAMFFFFVVRPFVKWLTDNTVESMESFLPKTIEELEKIQASDEGLQELEEAIPVIVDKVDPEKVEGEMIKEKVVTLVEGNPQKAAMILHEWVLATTMGANAAKKEAANNKKPASA